ncbi:MAG: chromosomal replication initiator protein DnaA, partial [Gammaproteobacteria bacterium]|nr:chromosomal replication initiator protein DnaA [Gammaproteobacteria bacterium]
MSKTMWSNCLHRLEQELSDQQLNTWIRPLQVIEENNQIKLLAPNRFVQDWVKQNFHEKIQSILLDLDAEQTIQLNIEIGTQNKSPIKDPEPAEPVRNESFFSNNKPKDNRSFVEHNLNPLFTFDNFVEGKSNQLAKAASIQVAENPGSAYNPLFFYGGVGLGKTHLAHAIGVDIKDRYPEKTVLYISAEKFTQQYIDSVKKNNRNDFIHFYQIIDVLIIDDVQFLSGKSGTQDVFFHIFNHLHQNGKQVILTSDKAPVDMQDIEQRLLSRFKWGLSAELQNPDFETRVSILKNKLYRDGVEMPDDIIEFVAKNIKSNVRELEGAIISLIAQSSFNKKEITLDLARQIVEKFVKNTKREVSIDYIQKIVSDYFQMDVDTLQSKTRKRHIVQARQLAMFFAKKFTKA